MNYTSAVLQKTYAEGIAHGKDLMENGAKVMHTSHSFEEANRGAFDYAKGADEVKENTRKLNDLNGDKSEYRKEKQAKKDQLINIHVGFGSDSSKQVTEITSSATAGGRLASEGTITVVARGNGKEGNVTAVGETIKGKDIIIQATKDIVLEAGTNTTKEETKADSKGWGVGASIGLSGNLMSVDAHVNMAKENGVNTIVTHTPTTVVGSDSVTLASGQDTTITGSQVAGKSVDVTVGRNLTITSLQDQNNYVSDAKSAGLSVSTGFSGGVPSISGNANKSHMESTYASVTTQAGIYAGTGGFDVTVGKTTKVTGALIDSAATADKNTLTAGNLVMEDIKNTAEYSQKGMGVSYTHYSKKEEAKAKSNDKGFIPMPTVGASGKASSTTKSAIAPGTITIKTPIDISKINRDTKNSLNELAKIFDKKKMEERQELARLVAKYGFEQLHKWEPKTDKERAEKAIAHGVVAELVSRLGGNGAGSGFAAGAINEALISKFGTTAKDHPEAAQWASFALGAMVNGALGKPVQAGGAVAQYGTKWNENAFEYAKEMSKPEVLANMTTDGTYREPASGTELIFGKIVEDAMKAGVYGYDPNTTVHVGAIVDAEFNRKSYLETASPGDVLAYAGNLDKVYVNPKDNQTYIRDEYGNEFRTGAPAQYSSSEYGKYMKEVRGAETKVAIWNGVRVEYWENPENGLAYWASVGPYNGPIFSYEALTGAEIDEGGRITGRWKGDESYQQFKIGKGKEPLIYKIEEDSYYCGGFPVHSNIIPRSERIDAYNEALQNSGKSIVFSLNSTFISSSEGLVFDTVLADKFGYKSKPIYSTLSAINNMVGTDSDINVYGPINSTLRVELDILSGVGNIFIAKRTKGLGKTFIKGVGLDGSIDYLKDSSLKPVPPDVQKEDQRAISAFNNQHI